MQHAPGAEFLRVQDGLIRHVTIVFDRMPFPAARQAAEARSQGKFFAFVGADGGLIVKLPAEAAAGLVAEGTATPVRAGRHADREGVTVPQASAGTGSRGATSPPTATTTRRGPSCSPPLLLRA